MNYKRERERKTKKKINRKERFNSYCEEQRVGSKLAEDSFVPERKDETLGHTSRR